MRIPVFRRFRGLILQENETIEDLQLNGLRLIQTKNGFRYGMDTVLLAHFANIRESDIVADFGTGSGILPLLLIGRNKGKQFYAIDIMPEAVQLSVRNVELNGLEDRIRVIHADAGDAAKYISPCSVDAVVCNPPYGQPSTSLVSPYTARAIARSQNRDTLNNMFSGAFQILKGKGKLFIVYPVQQMLNVMVKMQEHHLEPKHFRLVYPGAEKKANLVLIEAVKDAKPTLHPLPPLIIYQSDGSLTNELKSVYHIQNRPDSI